MSETKEVRVEVLHNLLFPVNNPPLDFERAVKEKLDKDLREKAQEVHHAAQLLLKAIRTDEDR